MSDDDDDDALPPGYELQGYVIERVLGRGGFGITYLARDRELDVRVAMKEFLPFQAAHRGSNYNVEPTRSGRGDYNNFLGAFRKEAQTLASFDHDNIVRVRRRFDANNTSYYVMDFLEGETLNRSLKRERLPGDAVVLIMEKLTDGILRVHDNGLMHRDIKPDNIVLVRNREPPPTRFVEIPEDILMEFGRPILIDFGAARVFRRDTSVSMTGVTSAGYSPIEQYSQSGRQDERTDIYALGAVAYAALDGVPPIESTLRRGRNDMPPAVERFRGEAPPEFLGAIDWALGIQPEERPPNVRVWREEMFPWISFDRSQSVSPGRSPSGGVSGRNSGGVASGPARRSRPSVYVSGNSRGATDARPFPFLIAGVGALALLGAGAGTWWYLNREDPNLAERDPINQIIDADTSEWQTVRLDQLGFRPGAYTVAADGPFRMRINGKVYTIDGGGSVDLTTDSSTTIEIRSINKQRTIHFSQ